MPSNQDGATRMTDSATSKNLNKDYYFRTRILTRKVNEDYFMGWCKLAPSNCHIRMIHPSIAFSDQYLQPQHMNLLLIKNGNG